MFLLGLTYFLQLRSSDFQVSGKPVVEQEKNRFSMQEVAIHNDDSSCWMVINNVVYDVTEFIPSHPGEDILSGCGRESTNLFEGQQQHRDKAANLLAKYSIGKLE